MSGASAQAVTVDYATADSSALAGTDYTATSGTLTIPVDSTSGVITVPITDDLVSESSEVFKLLLSGASGATLTDSLGLGTILDNEAAPTLSIADASVNEDAGTMAFTVTMSGISAQTVTVDFATADSSAIAGSDYTNTTGTLTIPMDSTSGVITVPITDDAISEGSEVFKMLLSNATGATISDSLGLGTILDNEAAPTLSIADASANEDAGTVAFTVTMSGISAQTVTVDFATADSSAIAGSDYTNTTGTLTIPMDSTTGIITVPLTDDLVSEGSEVFKMLLSGPSGASLTDSLGLGTILDNEAAPVLSIADASANEDAGTMAFTVTMSGISAQAVTVDYATADSSAIAGGDYANTTGTLTIPVDSTSGVITVPITDDLVSEGSEVFKLLLSNASGATLLDSLSLGTILDNEAAPTLSIADASANEDAGTMAFTVTMSGISAQTVTVDYASADSSALAGSDYTATSGTLTIPVDSTSGIITVPITDDAVSEGSEVFKMLLSGPSGASLTDSLGLGTIIDNEAAPTLSINDVNANEDAGTMAFIVTMSGISAQAVTVDYATSDSSAIAGSDYTATSGTLTIPINSTSGVITVPITDDLISEGSEVFKMLLSGPSGASLTDSLGLGTILDNEAAPVLSIADASANEDAGTMAFTVTMSGISAQAVTVDYATTDSTAIAGSDYVNTTATLTIPVDSTSGVITVPITDDAISEGSEVFKLLLSNASGATISDSLALGTIIDNEAAPTLSIADASANEDAGTMAFTVTMSGISAQTITVDYATADSSALAGTDYTATSGTLTIPLDSTTGIITVPITDDLVSEGSEVFKMLLSNASDATISDSLSLGTILDNDAAPVLSIADASANEDAGTMAFIVTMSGISAQAVNVDYATADSSALAGSDYTATSGTLTIPVDSTSGVITVPITDDLVSEGSEVFKLLLSNASGATISDSLALGTIIDNEAAPTLSIADASANEDAGTIDFTVTMSGISAQAVTVDYATADSSALSGSDYTATSGTLTIPLDSTTGIITVPITDDLVSEGSEVFKMLLSTATGATISDSLGLGTILDNEAAPTLSIADASTNEDTGTIDFTVSMSGISAQAVTVDYATSDSSAIAGSDYTATSGTLTIPIDSTSGVITVPITDDLISEGSEVFKMLLSGPSGASLTDSLGLGTILDNEAAPVLSIADASANEDAGTMAFTVTMSAISAQAVTVDYATADSSAIDGSDYANTTGTLTIPADSTSGVITVPITDDLISEGSEVFKMLLSNATGATISDSLALGTIIDNEVAPTLTIADASANEDAGTINFTVTMSGISAQTVTADYATADSSALAGSDYTAASGTLTIPVDSTTGVITVPLTDDLVSEGSEVFKMLLSNASGATLLDSLGLGTILDNEAAPVLSIADASANEDAGTMAFTVTMSGISAQAVTVDYATTDSTALAGSDYTATSGTLTIPVDSTSGVITVPITDDAINEGDEVFKLLLSGASGATLFDSLSLATILDNETAPALSINDVNADEDAGTINFTVTMSGISAQAVTVDYATTDSSAIAGSDYTATSGTLTIPVDSTTGVITVPITDDPVSEGSEVFKMLLSNASGATITDSLGLGTIIDNEAAPVLSIADASANEDAGTIDFTVTMSGISAQAITVDFATADSSAIAGSDYANTTGTLTIPMDSTSGVIIVPITDDAISEGSEVFKILLSNASGATLTDSLGLGTIIDNEAAPTLSINDASANEDAGTIDFTVTMSGISAQAVTVDYATSDSTAFAGSDYAATSGTLTIPVDSTSGVITVPITDDLISESSEVFKMLLSGASGATLLDSLGLGTILDNEAAPTLSINDVNANEDAGTIDFTVTMSGASAQAVTVDYATTDSTALAGSDYTATSGTLTIPVDSTSGVITVPITDDAINEGDEVFKLLLSGASGASLSDNLGLGTILDNEAAPTLSINDVNANEDAGTIDFIVTMSGISAQAITVDYATADSSALAGTDYAAASGTLTIPMDSTSGVIKVPITDDAVSEGSEVFKMLLSGASGATLLDSLGLGTILDNEAAPTLSINDASANEDAGTIDFTVTMSGISAQAITVDFATADSSAIAGSDYANTTGTLTIPMDSTSGVIIVPITDDAISEGSEVFKILLSNASGATLTDSLGLGTIIDNEAAPTLSINDASANEDAGTIDFTVTMSGISAQVVTVDYATADSSAIAGSDYTATSGTLTIPVDSTTGIITVPLTDDVISEGSEAFKMLLSNASGASLTDSLALGTILDNEAAPTLSINDVNANEDAGTINFTVTMSSISAQAVTVDYATSDSTALAGLDYATTSGTLTIPVDSTTGTITVPITDDAVSEGSEVFKMLLSNATGATISDSLALGTIIDNEAAPVLSIADASANEDAGTINFIVTMSGISAQAVTVDYVTADSSALAGTDYAATSGTLTIPIDSTSGVITVPITDDLVSEGSEVFKMLLSTATGATISDSLGLGTILDNEAAPTLSIADASANEDAGTIDFTVTMSGISAQAVTVDYATADSSAIAGSDYAATSGTLSIPVDSTTGIITVPITDDLVSEGSEVFKMLLSNASGATLLDSLGLGTIIDNEAVPVLSIADASANEDAGTIIFTVTMSGISAQAITVDYATADSSAIAGSDYANTTGTLTIPMDSTSGIITVPITDDAISEGSEVFKLLLSNASGATLLDSLGLGTILDNESAPTLSIADASANEDAGTMAFTVTMSGTSAQAVTVDYATADSSALSGSDYTANSGTLSIPMDSTSGVITVPITDDLVSEGSEVFKMLLSNASGATISDSLGLGTIIDNETVPVLSIADASANEDAGTIDFTVTMSGISAQAITVDFATADSSAIAGSDYANTTGTLTIPMDSTSGIITVPITDDAISEGSEVFKLLLSNASGATLLDSLGLGTILDNEAAPVLSIADASANEDAGTIDFTVTMSGTSAQAVTVDYATADSSALSGSDYTAASGTLTIPMDSTSGIITVPITDDAISEGSEIFKLQLSSAVGATLSDSLALGTIIDNETVPVLSIADASADEDAGTMTFSLTMSGISAQAVSLDFVTADSSAIAGSDYANTTGTLTIPVDSTNGVITVPITDDAISEGSEVFKMLLSNASGASLTDSLALGTILDNDAAPTLSVNDVSTDEAAGSVNFTVTMSGGSGQAITVDYTTTDSTAIAGSDYTAISGTLTIPVDSTSGIITVPITDDALIESTEVFKLVLSNASGATIADGLGLGTITDNEVLPTLSIADASADEAAGSIDFTVTLSATTTQTVTVDYATADSTAQAGSDYANTSGTLTIAANTASGTISVPITDDAATESTEVFKLVLNNPANATITDELGVGTITDNDASSSTTFEVRIAVDSDDAEESPSGSVDLTSSDLELVDDGGDQTVGLRFAAVNIPAGATITNAYVQFQVDEASTVATNLTIQGQAADNAATFTTSSDNVSSRPRTSAQASWSPPAWNTVGEAGPDQRTTNIATVIQEVVSRPGWVSGNALALIVTGTGKRVAESRRPGPTTAPLLHVEYTSGGGSTPALSISDANVNEDAGNIEFTVSLSATTTQSVTVDYTTADSTAQAGSDYTAASGTLTIAANTSSGTISVPITDDALVEPQEVFKLLLSNPANAIIIDGLALGTINDNDSALPTLSINDVSANEAAGSIDFTVSLSTTTTQSVTVDYGTADSTAQAGSDYASTSGTLTIAANTTSGTISVPITDDAVSESQEVFKLVLSNPANATIADGLGVGTITDNDVLPTLSIADASADEDAGSIDFTVTLSATSTQAVTVDYATADSTAQAGSDYTSTSGTLTIAANTAGGTISVPITDDAATEPQEVFKLILNNPANATIADALGVGAINDNDASSSTTFEVRVAADSDDAEEAPSGAVDLTSSDLELVDDGGDNQTVGVRFSGVNIPAGATITNAYVQFQADETSTAATSLTIQGQAADNPPTFTTSSDNVSSRARTSAQASWSPPAWNTVGEAGPDQRTTNIAAVIQEIVSRSGWNSGNALALIITGTGSRVAESRRGGIAAAPLLHVEYTTGGGEPPTPTLSINDVSANEAAGTIDFTVSLSTTTSQVVTVDYATADSTAQAGSDYTSTSGTLNIAANTAGGTISVPVTDDTASEPQEVFKLVLSNPSNATIADGVGVGTISDNDGAPTLSINNVSANEDAGTIDFTVTLSTTIAQAVTVDYATADSTAQAGSDYTDTSGTLNIAANTAGGTISVPVTDDASSEPQEVFKLVLSNPTNTTIADGLGVGTITDNDGPPTLSINNQNAGEAAGAMTFTVSMSAASGQTVTVDYATSDSTALDGSDYTAVSGTLTIPVDSTSGAITVPITDDALSEPLERFKLVLSNPANATISDGLGVGTITDNDSAPALSINDVNADEDAGTMTFDVTLSAVSGQVVTVDYATSDSTAQAGSDYTDTSGTLTIPIDSTGGTITVAIDDDASSESTEVFKLVLSNPSNATIADGLGVGTINDNDAGGQVVTVTLQDGVNGYSGTDDTQLDSTTPGTNYGTTDRIEMDGSPDVSTLIRWDLTSIPTGSNVQSVELTLYIRNGSPVLYDIYEMLRPWDESTANWTQYAAGQNWQIAGANGSGDRGTAPLGAITGSTGFNTFSLNAAGIGVVQGWVDNPSSNLGFAFLDYDEGSNGLAFFSSDRSTVEHRPQLTVTYSTGGTTGMQASKLAPNGLTPMSEEMSLIEEALPETVALNPNYPNPFSTETRIDYALPEQAHVRMEIFNVRGQRVRTLVDNVQDAGFKHVRWNGTDDARRPVGSGIYLIKLTVDGQQFTGKMILAK